MKTSVFNKVHRDILLEWSYDSNNKLSESFGIIKNIRDNNISYYGGQFGNNNLDNQLFNIDLIQNKWAKVDSKKFQFLVLEDYPITQNEHNSIRLRFPSNYNFAEYQGICLRVWTLDFDNKKQVTLSNFFYDKNDLSKSNLIDTILKPVLYEDRLWDKVINLEIPSVSWISKQRDLNGVIKDSLNYLLSDGVGLSITSPIFIDFHFITGISVIGKVKNYFLNNPFTVEIPQSPELEELKLVIKESDVGDYFEIYPTFNDSFEEFSDFVLSSRGINKVYYLEFKVTLFEENIKGRTTNYIIDGDFDEKVEWRPIIKYSTNSSFIDVEMRLIDKVSGSIISRKGVYGLTPDQLSKYSLSIKRINVQNIQKPKIYVKNLEESMDIDSIEKNKQNIDISIDVPTLYNLNNIHCYSDNDINQKFESTLDNFYPMGGIKILIEPFDNILTFQLAKKFETELDFIDLTNCQSLSISFRSQRNSYDFQLNNDLSDLPNGVCSFRIPQSKYLDIKKLFIEKTNLFYITTLNNDIRTLLYSGLFIPSDSLEGRNLQIDDSIGQSVGIGVINTFDEAVARRRRIE